jgi:hypothetical protein
VYWIGEICNADWRERVMQTADANPLKEWFATRTLADAIRSYENVNQ